MVELTYLPLGLIIGFVFSSFFIDIITLFLAFLFPSLFYKKKEFTNKKPDSVSIIIPAYNEEKLISKVIDSAFNQTLKPKQVIVINDNSKDKTLEKCEEAKKKYKNLIIVNQKENKGKAYNISYAVKNFKLGEVTIILDADTFIFKNYLEEITKPFVNNRVAIVTGSGLPLKIKGFFAKIVYFGVIYQFLFFGFRKRSQGLRNSISVITGDSAAYKSSFLKSVGGLPQGTQTEDMDITWLALEQGYRVVYRKQAHSRSFFSSTLPEHWKQLTRWYAGSFQCLVKHGRRLRKAKPMLYTTLLPTFLNSFVYGTIFLLLPLLFFILPSLALGFLIADFIFTVISIIYVDFRGLIHLPEVYIIKYLWTLIWFYAAGKTFFEVLRGKRSWSGKWERVGFFSQNK